MKIVGYSLTLPRIRRLVAEISPDVVHAHYAISYGVLGAFSGFRPLVIGAWGSDILVSPGRSKIRWAILRHSMKKADLIISLAEHITQVLIENGIEGGKIDTLPFGVNTGVFFRPSEEEESREIDVISSRNFDQLYNIEALLKAVKIAKGKRPNLRLVLAGDGARRELLKDLSRQLGIAENITWLGWMLPDELAGWLRRSKIYVSPSLSDGTSTALTEAMASGCFPIASAIEANRPWIRDGETGFLVPESRPDQLAERILIALESPDLRRKAAKLNEATVQERANWHSIMDRVERHYFSLVKSARAARNPTLSEAL